MQPLNDDELCELLRAWEAPAAPARLERRIFGAPRNEPWYRWLLTGSIRVPAPALIALLLLLFSAWLYIRPRRQPELPAAMREVKFSDFQPVPELKPKVIRSVYENR